MLVYFLFNKSNNGWKSSKIETERERPARLEPAWGPSPGSPPGRAGTAWPNRDGKRPPLGLRRGSDDGAGRNRIESKPHPRSLGAGLFASQL